MRFPSEVEKIGDGAAYFYPILGENWHKDIELVSTTMTVQYIIPDKAFLPPGNKFSDSAQNPTHLVLVVLKSNSAVYSLNFGDKTSRNTVFLSQHRCETDLWL